MRSWANERAVRHVKTGAAALATCFLIAVSAAWAAPSEWYYNRVAIPEGATDVVPTFNGPKDTTVVLYLPKLPEIKAVCTTSGTTAFANTPLGGRSETRTLAFTCPAGTTVTPLLPLFSSLTESAYPLHDRWEGITLEYTTGGVSYGAFTGSLESQVGDVDPLAEREREAGKPDEFDNYLTFQGGLKHALLGANGSRLWLAGTYRLGPPTEAITDESGIFAP